MSDFIREPETTPPTRTRFSPQEMRRMIREHCYSNGGSAIIVRRSLDVAAMIGLSGEETYLLVAFNLMKSYDRLFSDQIDYINRTAMPSFFIPKPEEPKKT